MENNKWSESTYQLVFSLANKQHSILQRQEIKDALCIEAASYKKIKKNRL